MIIIEREDKWAGEGSHILQQCIGQPARGEERERPEQQLNRAHRVRVNGTNGSHKVEQEGCQIVILLRLERARRVRRRPNPSHWLMRAVLP